MNTTDTWTPRRLFRTVAVAEAITWTLLILGMVGKYALDLGGLGVTIGGGLHGFVFLLYVAVAVLVGVNQRWSAVVLLVTLSTSILPFATLAMDGWLEKRGRLDGNWRRTAGSDPADARPADRVLRTLLAHPGRMALIGLAAVALIFTALLVVGPPGSRA
jgi:integral membrane protein